MTTPNLRVLDALPPLERRTLWQVQPVELPLYRKQLTALLEASGFEVLATSSAVAGMGRRGIHRLVNSAKLRILMRHLGVHHWWERLVLKHDFGMYLTTVAKLLMQKAGYCFVLNLSGTLPVCSTAPATPATPRRALHSSLLLLCLSRPPSAPGLVNPKRSRACVVQASEGGCLPVQDRDAHLKAVGAIGRFFCRPPVHHCAGTDPGRRRESRESTDGLP
jgi:hypothetical protein